ncbi:MAG: hypothetical protein V3V74_00395, partial [Nitrosomonadaceae bacterium]
IHSDDGQPIIKERTTASIHGGLYERPGEKIFFDEVEFVFASGVTEVAGTGLGPQPPVITGICGTTANLNQGDLLASSGLINSFAHIDQTGPKAAGVNFENSKIVSFTGSNVLRAGNESGAGVQSYFIQVLNNDTDAINFGFSLESFLGRYVLIGSNAAGDEILNATILQDGATFVDGIVHTISGVIDLSDPTRREIWIKNGTDAPINITDNTSWVTWNTYTDDTMQLEDTGLNPGRLIYRFGKSMNGSGNEEDSAGLVSFDNKCSLIPSALWDSNGWLRDPQAWQGWYMAQPKVFFLSWWKNSGTTAPIFAGENDMELGSADVYDGFISFDPADPLRSQMLFNVGVGANVNANDGLPDAPTESRVEIVSPFWSNTGNWIDLSKLTNTTFASMFGVAIEGDSFSDVFSVDKAALVNTSDTGNRLRIQDSIDCTNAALFITDSDGDVVDTMIYSGVQSGDSVLVPTGANYYVVITSDTSNAKVRKWNLDG